MDAALLQCIICPGRPRFSDVSHLLTHVSSKAHLSHYFKLQVRSHQEAEALELLLEYDGWFNTNNLPQLLSERIGSKDDGKKKRKSQAKAPTTTTDNGRPAASIRSRRSGPVDPNPRPSTSLPEYLDPRLADSYDEVKRLGDEDASFSCQVTPVASAFVTAGVSGHDAHVGTGTAQAEGNARLGEWPGEDTPGRRGAYSAPFPVTPSPPTRIRNRPHQVTWRLGSIDLVSLTDGVSKTSNELLDDVDADADKERADEMAKLKGVLWPGMDIFDSATQQMRRKRNQKKDGTVLRRMQLTSSLVEPTELVFSPSGILRKQRVITGNVEDDSPLKGESPIPKRRPPQLRPSRSKRRALAEIDPNVARGQDRKRAKRAIHQEPSGAKDEAPRDNPTVLRFQNPLSGLKPSIAAGDEEFDLSVQAFGKRARSGFAIFTDGDDRDIQASERQHAEPKFLRDTLTPARLILDGKSETSTTRGRKTEQSTFDKENIEPFFNSQGRIDFSAWGNSPFLKRNSRPRYTSRSVFDDPSTMYFDYEDDHDAYGYRSNPLLVPSSKLGLYEDDEHDGTVPIVSNGWTATTQPASSEATEEDHHELAQLYLESTAD